MNEVGAGFSGGQKGRRVGGPVSFLFSKTGGGGVLDISFLQFLSSSKSSDGSAEGDDL